VFFMTQINELPRKDTLLTTFSKLRKSFLTSLSATLPKNVNAKKIFQFAKKYPQFVIGGGILAVLLLGTGSSVLLASVNQDNRNQAKSTVQCGPNESAGLGCGVGCSLGTQEKYCNADGTGYTCYRSSKCGTTTNPVIDNPARPSTQPSTPNQTTPNQGGSQTTSTCAFTENGKTSTYNKGAKWCRDSTRIAECKDGGSVSITFCPDDSSCTNDQCVKGAEVAFTGSCSGTSIPECKYRKGGEEICLNGKMNICTGNKEGVCKAEPTEMPLCKSTNESCSSESQCCNGLTCDQDTKKCKLPLNTTLQTISCPDGMVDLGTACGAYSLISL
jgi:hypothetical protein